MTEIAKKKAAARQKKRQDLLNEIARAHGYESWTRLETAVLDGRASIVSIPMASTIYNTDTTSD